MNKKRKKKNNEQKAEGEVTLRVDELSTLIHFLQLFKPFECGTREKRR